MSQHDYDLANAAGAAFRADLNNAMLAVVSQNSGATEPATKFAYQWWADTTTGKLKQRNAANTAWIEIGTLASTNLGLALVGGSATQDFLAQKFTLSGSLLQKVATNIASAATIDLTASVGNSAHVTGTTTITAVTLAAGKFYQIIFDGALTLTHHATNNNLPSGANITTAAGDRAMYWSDGTTVYCVDYVKASGQAVVSYSPTAANALSGSVVQVVTYTTGAVATGVTPIPNDDTIPQNTEGDQYMTLAITPTNASNKLIIDAVGVYSYGTTGRVFQAIFQDTTANALAASPSLHAAASPAQAITTRHIMTAGTTSSTTFKVRAGGDQGANTTTFNGNGGVRMFGGVAASSVTITEVKA